MKNILKLRKLLIKNLVDKGIPKEVLERVCITDNDLNNIVKEICNIKPMPQRILEIGSYVGVSSILLSNLCTDILVTIDPNLSIDTDLNDIRLNKQTKDFFNELVYDFSDKNKIIRLDCFFSKIPRNEFIQCHNKFTKNIDAIKIMDTNLLKEYEPFDVVFVDGDHYSDGVYSDLARIMTLSYTPKLILLHDVQDRWGKEVKKGIKQFINDFKGFKFYESDNIGVLVREQKNIKIDVADLNTDKKQEINATIENIVKRNKGITTFKIVNETNLIIEEVKNGKKV